MGGIVGYQEPALRTFEHELLADAVVIMHSDGVSRRWNRHQVGQLLSGTPLIIAATVLRDAGTRDDDACVLVGRAR
jgi:hypothetical protein